MTAPTAPSAQMWFTPGDYRIDDFRVEQTTRPDDYPYADAVESNVLVYGERLRNHVDSVEGRRDVQAELARALMTGPGIVLVKGAFPADVVDRATAAFTAMIDEQKAAGIAAATTSPSRAPTTGSGAPWTSSPSATPRPSLTTTPTTSSR